MERYMVRSSKSESSEILEKEKALRIYEHWKEAEMESGVVAGESYVELVVSNDGFETEESVEFVVAIIDVEKHRQLGHPSEQGLEYEYWAKWQKM